MLFQSLAVATLALAAAPLGADAHVVSPRNAHHKALAVRNAAKYPDPNANATIPAIHKRGQHFTGRGTWYDLEIRYAETVGETGSVACGGSTENNSARIVAVNQAQFQGSCGRTVAISYKGNTARGVTVRDQCPSGYCSWGALDLSVKVFAELASMDVGVLQGMEWWFEDEEGGGSEEEKPKTTSQWTPPAETTPAWTPPAETSTTPVWTPPAETTTSSSWTTTEPLTSTTESLSSTTEWLTNTTLPTMTMTNSTNTTLPTATLTNGTTTLLPTATTTNGTAAATATGILPAAGDITTEKQTDNPKGNLACTAKLVLQVGGLVVTAAQSAGAK